MGDEHLPQTEATGQLEAIEANMVRIIELEPLIDRPEIFQRRLLEEDFMGLPGLHERFQQETLMVDEVAAKIVQNAGIDKDKAIAKAYRLRDDKFNPFRLNKLGNLLFWTQTVINGTVDVTRETYKSAKEVLDSRFDEIGLRLIRLSVLLRRKKVEGIPVEVDEAKQVMKFGKLARSVLQLSKGIQPEYDVEALLKDLNLNDNPSE